MRYLEGKSPLHSKTVWINVIALAAIVVQKATGTDYVDAETQMALLAVVNLIVRVFTKQPLELRRDGPSTWLLVLLALLSPTLASGQTLPGNVCATLRAERAKPIYGATPDGPRLVALLNAVAWWHPGIGLSGKPSGTNCLRSDGALVACDILHRQSDNLVWDVLDAAGRGGPANVNCGAALGVMTDPARPWVAPTDPGGEPPPPPPPPPPSSDLLAIKAAVDAVASRIEALEPQIEQARVESLNAAIRALENQAKLDALLARPLPSCPPIDFPAYQGAMLGFKVVLRPVK